MEKLVSVSFADFKKANKIVAVHNTVKRSSGNGLFVTFLTSDLDAEGKQIAKNVWFARTVAEKGLVSEGQSTAELGISEMIVIDTKNEAGELRQKLAYAGEGNYTAI